MPEADRRVADMEGPAALPRENGELVFEAPWEGRAFGIAVALAEQGRYEWEDFRQWLIGVINAVRGEPVEPSFRGRTLRQAHHERMVLTAISNIRYYWPPF